jgi:drug/metabolite transporter (DMT)-like permease
MPMGLLFCFLGAISFGLLGTSLKAAERSKADAAGLVVAAYAWPALLMLVRTLLLKPGGHVPAKVYVIAVTFGICAAVASLAFQVSISIGKVTVGWLTMNLSAGIPVIVSVWMYHEKLTVLKISALGLVLLSICFLFWGQVAERRAIARNPAQGG